MIRDIGSKKPRQSSITDLPIFMIDHINWNGLDTIGATTLPKRQQLLVRGDGEDCHDFCPSPTSVTHSYKTTYSNGAD